MDGRPLPLFDSRRRVSGILFPSLANKIMPKLIFSWNRWSSRLASRLRFNSAQSPAPRLANAPPPRHRLILYDYEASPWCRLVREQATILNLQLQIRPCPRQTLSLEGAYDETSRFRSQAMKHYKLKFPDKDDLTFPLLVDKTPQYTHKNGSKDPVVIHQSYEIIQHLWRHYGQDVITRKMREHNEARPDQLINDNRIPFPIKFLSLAGPSYLRPFPTCGLLQMASKNYIDDEITLYHLEGCPDSRLVRELLCCLELPYTSVVAVPKHPVGDDNKDVLSASFMHDTHVIIPRMTIRAASIDDSDNFRDKEVDERSLPVATLVGAADCVDYLWETYWDNAQPLPTWWQSLPKGPEKNLGRRGSFALGAYTAFLKGNRALVPQEALD